MRSLGCWLVDVGASILAYLADRHRAREQQRYARQCYLDAIRSVYPQEAWR